MNWVEVPQDQVKRRNRIEARYPHWYIEYRSGKRDWRAIREGTPGTIIFIEHGLRPLLDRIEAHEARRASV